MRADRLLSILLLLQVHRRLTAGELARRLEVSERTIYRDMDALSAAGVPVYAERGAGGGCCLADAYRTDLTGLSDGEVRALFLAGPGRLLADLGLRGAAETALVKLLAALPAPARRDAEYARQRIHVDAGGWNRPEEAVPTLPALQAAVWRERRLRFTYRRADGGAVERLADPLGLVAKGGVWYLVAAIEGEVRTYRVSRVLDAQPTDQPFVRPAGFDLAAHWERAAADFQAGLPRYAATLRADPAILPRLHHAGRFARIERVGPPEADGWYTVAIRFETEEEAGEYALGFGPRLAVIEPPALRERVVHLAREVVARYG